MAERQRIRWSPSGRRTIAVALAIFCGFLVVRETTAARRIAQLESRLGADRPDLVVDAVCELLYCDDRRADDLVYGLLASSRDPAVVQAVREQLLLRNGMMPTAPRPAYPTEGISPRLDIENGEIDLVFDGPVPEPLREVVRGAVRRFGVPLREPHVSWEFSDAAVGLRTGGREQFTLEGMIQTVLRHLGRIRGRCLVVTERDTFYPPRRWDTGASLGFGPVSIVSVRRLDPAFWGAPPDEPLHAERLRKVVVHELGHTYLPTNRHCPNWGCIMHATESLADIDRLAGDYCRPCGAIIARTVRDLAQGFPLEPDR